MSARIILVVIPLFSIYLAQAQITTTPNSIYIGFEGGEIQDDTIFVWDKVRGHLRSGRFDNASSNFIDVGYFSQSLGNANIASGESSFAANVENIASGIGSTSFGWENKAAGGYSAVFGRGNESFYFFETVVGKHNRVATSGGAVPLFTVGNGGTSSTRANAFIVTRENYVGIGDVDPESDLHIVHSNGDDSGIRIENTSSEKHWRIHAGSTDNDDKLALFYDGGASPVGTFDPSGTYAALSDKRMKNDISPLTHGLETVLKLKPVSYHFNHIQRDMKSIGFIAQEVEKIIPEAVSYNEANDQYQLYYDSFTPVAIKAIQDLNEVVEEQSETIRDQKALIAELIKRVELLEESN